MKRLAWLGRAPTVIVVAVAVWAARREGGAAERPALPPRPAPPALAATASTARVGNEAYEVVERFTERLADAQVDAPGLRSAEDAFAEYWRKMPSPWTGLEGDRKTLVYDVALVTSGAEKQLSVPLGSGRVWLPDARKWNMSEGSFDEREAIFAPAPSTFRFTVTVPRSAKLSFAPALASGQGVDLAVRAVDASGVSHELYARHVGAGEAKRWLDEAVDLGAFGGQRIDLVFATSVTEASEGQRAPVALWGHPTLLARQRPRVPYNVLWIVIDALRPDVIASFHDDAEDAAKLGAEHPPLDALLPKIPGLTPSIDALAARGVRFVHAYSGGAWTRPGTLAMLAGARSSELGVDTLFWPLSSAETGKFYASRPPLLPLLLRRQGVATRAFVNNFFMSGYAHVALDFGFERTDDERYRTADTAAITREAVTWLRAHKDERFFAFCNYNSPHDPYDPPDRMLARVPKPPAGPLDALVGKYMAEGAKDDEAVGVLMQTIDELGLRGDTIVVLTADHGETLSRAHDGQAKLDKMPIRFHHAVGNYEETTRIPILVSLPGVLPEGAAVKARVRNVDLAPTILALEGLEPDPKMSGASLVALARGKDEADERVVVSEGRGTRAILSGADRLIVREGDAQSITLGDKELHVAEELYDLASDPGERVNLARAKPDKVAEMRARLTAALANVPVVGTAASLATTGPAPPGVLASAEPLPRIRLRFAGAGQVHRVRGTIAVADGATVSVTPVGVGPEAYRVVDGRVEVSLSTVTDAPVGLDLVVTPPEAAVRWELFWDDHAWPQGHVYGGPFGLSAPLLRLGIATNEARDASFAKVLPQIDASADEGLFVTRERGGEASGPGAPTGEGAQEMDRLLREWGYAHGASGKGP
jgi:arylsulfatase A-like enzyme